MRYLRHYLGLVLIAVVLLLQSTVAFALDVPATPTTSPVVDQTNTLTLEQQTSLAAIIADERAKTSNQIALLIIPTLAGDSLEDYSIRVARAWGIGEKDKDNGVLLLVVKDDHKLRIEVGYGLEGALPDAKAAQIMRYKITPEFKKGRYYEGINSGLQSIIATIHNEYDPALESGAGSKLEYVDRKITASLLIVSMVFMWLSSILARSKTWWAGGIVGGVLGAVIGMIFDLALLGVAAIIIFIVLGLIFDWLISNNYKNRKASRRSPSWWAGGTNFGGGSSGSSGGSSGGFGGGGFGGGGSSGSW